MLPAKTFSRFTAMLLTLTMVFGLMTINVLAEDYAEYTGSGYEYEYEQSNCVEVEESAPQETESSEEEAPEVEIEEESSEEEPYEPEVEIEEEPSEEEPYEPEVEIEEEPSEEEPYEPEVEIEEEPSEEESHEPEVEIEEEPSEEESHEPEVEIEEEPSEEELYEPEVEIEEEPSDEEPYEPEVEIEEEPSEEEPHEPEVEIEIEEESSDEEPYEPEVEIETEEEPYDEHDLDEDEIEPDYYEPLTPYLILTAFAAFEMEPEPELPPPPNWNDALNGALGWLLAGSPNPSIVDEWAVLSAARANINAGDWYDRYLSNIGAALSQGNALNSWTDYARVTLALTALGVDASDFGGRNLLTPISTFVAAANRPAHSAGINADIFALIALNSRPYTGDQMQFVNAILAAQDSSGGWDGWGWGADIDTTAMAIQALAPYYNSDSAVTAAVTNALNWFPMQFINGPEEYAQIIVALTALGYDPGEYITELLAFYDHATGGFRSAAWYWDGMMGGGEVNEMSTEQAAFALSAYSRFVSGLSPIHDMRDAADWDIDPPDVPLPPGGGGGGGNIAPPPGSDEEDATAFISVRDGATVFFEGEVEIEPNETAYSILHRTGLTIESRAGYVVSINGLAEFDYGPLSGWKFRINDGDFPPFAATQFPLQDGDTVEWVYTRDLGEDVGGGAFPGADAGSVAGSGAGASGETQGLSISTINDLIQEGTPLTIETAVATVTFDLATLRGLAYNENVNAPIHLAVELLGTGNNSPLTRYQRAVVGNNRAFSFVLTVDDEIVTEFAGNVTVSIPFVPPVRLPRADRDLLTVYHIDEEGNTREMPGARFYNRAMRFTTSHFSTFFISEWISPFTDVSRSDDFIRAVRFVYSNGLLGEYLGEDAEEFLPDASLTYALLYTMLWEMLDAPDELPEDYEPMAANLDDYVTFERFVDAIQHYARLFLEIEIAEIAEMDDELSNDFTATHAVTRAEAAQMLRFIHENAMQ